MLQMNKGMSVTVSVVRTTAVGSDWCVQPENEDDLKKLQLMELALMNGTYRGVEGNIVPFVAAAVSRTFTSILHYCAVILCSFIVSYMFYIMLDILLVYIGRYGPASVTYLTILDAVHRLNYGKKFLSSPTTKIIYGPPLYMYSRYSSATEQL